MAMVPKKGRKKEVLRQEKSNATAANRIYFRQSDMMLKPMVIQWRGVSEGYCIEAKKITPAESKPSITELIIRNRAIPRNLPSTYTVRETGRDRTDAAYRLSISRQIDEAPNKVARIRRRADMAERDRVMPSSCTCRMENELKTGTRNIQNKATPSTP
jgi:hypothetical protein